MLGISWGGGLAQQFALSRPDRVRRLVLVATGPGALMVPAHPQVLLRMLTPRRHRDPGYAARIAGELYGGSAAEDQVRARDLLHGRRRSGRAGLLLPATLRGGLDEPAVAAAVRQPTLILAGDDDPIIPLVNARMMHWMIPRNAFHIYHGGHLEMIADPERSLQSGIVSERETSRGKGP